MSLLNLPQGVQARQHRVAVFDRASVDVDARTADLAFSSETPVERFWGVEILGHAAGEVDAAWISGGTAPLLLDHNSRELVGVVERAAVDADRKGRCTVRFSRSAKATEVLQDVADGIRTNVSVGYEILEARLDREEKGKPPVYRITRWKPLEVSLVAIPADDTVGVGRSDPARPPIPAQPKESRMDPITDPQAPPAPPNPDAAGAAESRRQKDIMDLARLANCADHGVEAVLRGVTVEAFRGEVLLARRGQQKPLGTPAAEIGMTPKEVERYSMVKAMRALTERNWDKAGLELEASEAVAKRMGRTPQGFFVPLEVQERAAPPSGQRDLSAVAAPAGGYLVPTANQGFIDQLRGRSVTMNMGATRLTGLSGNITVPRQTNPATAVWLGTETTAATETQQTFGQMPLTPKNVAAYTEVSRQLLLQSSLAVDQLVMGDLAAVVALALDLAAIAGTGAGGQPLGINNTAGIGSVTGTTLGWAGIVEFQTDTAGANALINLGDCGYVTTVPVAGLMMQRQRFTSTDTPLWQGGVMDGTMGGFKAMSSTQMPTATMLFGDWSQLVIAEWGALDIEMNPFANFPAGIYGFRAFYTADVGVRYPASFSLATGIT